MPRVIFMCGPAGSGKSTVARELEAEGMARLSFDEEAWARGHRSMPLPPEVEKQLCALLKERAVELVREGRDLVLDFSFWSRRMRDEWRALLAPLGVEPETVYLATDRATVLERLRRRDGDHADAFRLPPEVAARYVDHFEPPTEAEGPLTVVR